MDVSQIAGLQLAGAELESAINRLCLFGASGERNYIEDLVNFLALHSLALLPPGFHSVEEIFVQLKGIITFSFEREEMVEALKRLNEREEIQYRSSGGVAEYRMDVQKISQLRSRYKEAERLEKNVFAEWTEEVFQRCPKLATGDLDNLVADLKLFMLRLFSQHAAESVALYYGGREDLLRIIDQMDSESIASILPTRARYIHEVRIRELPRFFKEGPVERKLFLASRLNSVFILHLLQLDPTCSALAREQIPGGTLYLDTNFVYRLLGLQGPILLSAAKRLAEVSDSLGYTMVVSPRTIEEYKVSLDGFLHGMRPRQWLTVLSHNRCENVVT